MSAVCGPYFAALPDGARIHYRRAGSGPPLLALHASPLSSRFLAPISELFAPRRTVLAPDTPGYGLSTPLPEAMAATDLSPYVQRLAEFLQALNIPRTALYGTATGAQLAVEFARAHPQQVEFVVLDNAASFVPAQRSAIMEHYFPDLTPRADATHLATAWTMARDLYSFFPWCARDDAHRLPTAPPPLQAIHQVSRATLAAGADYARAYRAAFMNEEARRVQSLSVPVVVIRWAGSILRRYMDAFDELQWPPHIHIVDCGASPEERLATLQREVFSRTAENATGQPLDPPSAEAARADQQPALNYRLAGAARIGILERAGEGTPLVVLADFASSAATTWRQIRHSPLASRPLGILDLPGHGVSDAPPECAPQPFLEMIRQALDEWRGGADFELLGVGGAGLAALQLGCIMAPRVRRVLLAGGRPVAGQLCAQAAPDVAPRWDGGHWQSAWYAARDACLFRPWYQRDAEHRRTPLGDLSAGALHRGCLDLMDCAESLPALLEAFGRQSWEEAQAQCPCPVDAAPC